MSRVFSVQFTPGQDHEFLSGGWDDTIQVIHILTTSKCLIDNACLPKERYNIFREKNP